MALNPLLSLEDQKQQRVDCFERIKGRIQAIAVRVHDERELTRNPNAGLGAVEKDRCERIGHHEQ